MPLPQYSITLKQQSLISNNSLQLELEFSDGVPQDFSFTAGQFIQFLIDDGTKIQKRSYSIACSPESFDKTGILEVAISLVKGGLASDLFAQAEAGLSFNMSGPYGVLTLPETCAGQLVLVGTGTGIAPYRSMIPLLQKKAAQGTPVTIVMGSRHQDDLIYLEDFSHLDNIDYRVCLSRETELIGKNEFAGYVQQQFPSLNLNPETDLIYLCGNPGMIDDAAVELKEMGFPPRQVKREKYVFSGH